jgi:hypothetical protein
MEGFREIWDTDFLIEDSSRRRQESSYGFINSRFLSKPVSTESTAKLGHIQLVVIGHSV